MPTAQSRKARTFADLHAAAPSFVIANAWDAGTARILTGLGFPALASSSGAAAGTLGRRDGRITRDEALAHAKAIVDATELPVSADLENGFGDTAADCALTICGAISAGLVGGSIEDFSGRSLYPEDIAIDRVAAAVAVARAAPFPFVLTARCENFIRGNPDLDDTIGRLKAYEAAGADVLMAPGLPDLDAVRKVCEALGKPFNFMGGVPGRSFSVAELQAAGVKRISLATSLYRAAMTGLVVAAREVRESGTFGYLDGTMKTAELNAWMKD